MRYFIFIVRIILFPFAVFFTLACLYIHVASVFGVNSEYIPPLYIIILSLLLVHIPSFIIQQINRKKEEDREGKFYRKDKKSRYGITEHAPKWLRRTLNVYLIYAIFNFFYFPYSLMTNYQGGEPVLKNNEYKLENHGKEIKKMTLKEVEEHNAMTIRFYSGHLLFLYLMNCVALYPKLEKKEDDEDFEEVKKDKPLS